jgi:transcriptional regulator with XRE-family HTH domain
MSKGCDNGYKLCREDAGLPQEQAAEALHVSTRTLSDYENGRTKAPDDIVSAMAERYNTPLLVWWHLKHHSVLGKYLPDIQVPQTHGDMAFQAVLVKDDIDPAVVLIKKIMADGKICEQDQDDLQEFRNRFMSSKEKILSVILYLERIMQTSNKKI